MDNTSYMSGQWPKLGPIDVRVIFLWVAGVLIMRVWPEYWKLASALTFIFVISHYMGMSLSMFMRYIRTKIFGSKKYSYPKSQRGGFLLIALSLGLAGAHDQTFAEYELVDSVKYGLDWQRGYPGTRDEDIVEGFQSNFPIEDVLETILPKDIVFLWGEGVSKSTKISWAGPKPWGHILRRIAKENNLRIELQREGNRLIIENATVGAFVYNHSADSVNSKLLALTNKKWQLQKGKKLSNNLREWAISDGWTIAWNLGREYIIDVDATYQGSLISVVQEVIKSYRTQGVMGRVKVKAFTANKTISIYQSGER